jgi:hypothetical protein
VKIASAFQASYGAVYDLQVNRDNPEWMDYARKTHAEAEAAMRNLIDANFSWSVFGPSVVTAQGWGCRCPQAVDQPGGQTTG